MKEFRVWNGSNKRTQEVIRMTDSTNWTGDVQSGNPGYLNAENFALRGDGVILEKRKRSDMFEPTKREYLVIEPYSNIKDKYGRKVYHGDIVLQKVKRHTYGGRSRQTLNDKKDYYLHKEMVCEGIPLRCKLVWTSETREEHENISSPKGTERGHRWIQENSYSDIEVVGNIHDKEGENAV